MPTLSASEIKKLAKTTVIGDVDFMRWQGVPVSVLAEYIKLAQTALDLYERVDILEKENKDLRLVNDEIQRREWLKFIRFVRRHKEQASVAKDLLYFSEMEKSLKNCENWYRNIYGETVEDDLLLCSHLKRVWLCANG